MFTGIIETTGIISKVEQAGTNTSFFIRSTISDSLKVDQSLSHNGVCLTVEAVEAGTHRVTAIDETLQKTNLGSLKAGDIVNLERCMQMNGRLDGHIVQGHVDGTAVCTSVVEKNGSWEYRFMMNPAFAALIIEKGSITLNGISLTIFNITRDAFSVAIIPYTYEHTNMKTLKKSDIVNLEYDMIGKYINRMQQLKS